MEETTVTEVPFVESASNLESWDNFNYLLNFWYTTKLNKENNFIKRNGLHPKLNFRIQGIDLDGYNDFTVDGGSEISTQFYTVFRIYLENIFKDYKISKTRNVQEWAADLDSYNIYGLDNNILLKIYYATRSQLDASRLKILKLNNRSISNPNFKIKSTNSEMLFSKSVLEDLNTLDEAITNRLTESLLSVTDTLFQSKLKTYAGLKESTEHATPKKVVKKQTTIVDRQYTSLVELYNSMANSMPANFDDRTKFSFIISFANQSGLPSVPDTETNFNTFRSLLRAA